jgi:hypothetical protein
LRQRDNGYDLDLSILVKEGFDEQGNENTAGKNGSHTRGSFLVFFLGQVSARVQPACAMFGGTGNPNVYRG